MRARASRTAVLVCQGRAAAHDRIAVGRFSDPVAMSLLQDGERTVVQQERRDAPPKGWGARMNYEFVRGCAALMAPRTIAIDDAIREHPSEQLVILGAGLDARAWRMGELAGTIAFEVDHPATQGDKRQRLGQRTPAAREVRFVATDLAQQGIGAALDRAGHRTEAPTTWVWEGVVPYLTAAQVVATVAAVQTRSAPGSRLVVNYQVPSTKAAVGQLIGRGMMRLARSPDPWSDEPHRSHWTPDQLSSLLEAHGFSTISDRDLLEISLALGLPRRAGDLGGSLPNGHVLLADRR
ncbi:MAG: class I SAM-dependent methyltransferase [Jatrophihabitantaceae bacterium]